MVLTTETLDCSSLWIFRSFVFNIIVIPYLPFPTPQEKMISSSVVLLQDGQGRAGQARAAAGSGAI